MAGLPRIGSQRRAIADFLLSGNSLTSLEAIGLFRSFRLAAQVKALRKYYGLNIHTESCRDVTGKEYGKYSIPAPLAITISRRDMISGPRYA